MEGEREMDKPIYYVHKQLGTALSYEKLKSLLQEGVERITISHVPPLGEIQTKEYSIRDIPFNHDFDLIVIPKMTDYQIATLINSVGFTHTSTEDKEEIRDILYKELELLNKLRFRGVELNG